MLPWHYISLQNIVNAVDVSVNAEGVMANMIYFSILANVISPSMFFPFVKLLKKIKNDSMDFFSATGANGHSKNTLNKYDFIYLFIFVL